MGQFLKNWSFSDYVDLNEADAGGGKAKGSNTKSQVLFDEADWKFLLQFPPRYWRRALQWRYNEGLLSASEVRERNGLNDESLPEHENKIEFMDGKRKISILPPKGQEKVYTGFKQLFNKIETPVKLSHHKNATEDPRCSDPAEAKERIEARNKKLPDGPGIDQLNLFNSSDPKHASLHHPDKYQGGFIGGDLTNPNRISQEKIEGMEDSDRKRKNPPHTFGGWDVMDYEASSKSLMQWVKGSSFIRDKSGIEEPLLPSRSQLAGGKRYVKDPYTGEQLEVHMMSPRQINKQWGSFLGKSDDVSWRHSSGDVGGKSLDLLTPVVFRKVCYRVKRPNGPEENRCEEYPMPVLGDGRAMPSLGKSYQYQKDQDVHLSDIQQKALIERKIKDLRDEYEMLSQEMSSLQEREKNSNSFPLSPEETKRLNALERERDDLSDDIKELSDNRDATSQERLRIATDRKKGVDKLLNAPTPSGPSLLARKPLSPKDYARAIKLSGKDLKTGKDLSAASDSKLARLDTIINHPDKNWGSIGEVDNLFPAYDLLHPGQRELLRKQQRGVHHLAAWNNDIGHREKWDDPHSAQNRHYILGGFSPMYMQNPTGPLPSNEDIQNSIWRKYGAMLDEEATKGVEQHISLVARQTGVDTSKRKRVANSEESIVSAEKAGEYTALVDNKDKIVDVATALLALQLNTALRGVYDPELCLSSAVPGSEEQAKNNRIAYARQVAWRMGQLALETASGARIPTRRQREANKRFKTGSAEQIAVSGHEASSDARKEKMGAVPNKQGRIWGDTDKGGTLARSHWLPVEFKTISKYFDSLHDQLKALKGDMARNAESSINKLEVNLDKSLEVWNTLYHREYARLTDEGIAAEDPQKHDLAMASASKKLHAALMEKFPEISPEEAKALADRTKSQTPSATIAPDWFVEAVEDLVDSGVGVLEMPGEDSQPYTIKIRDLVSRVEKGADGIVKFIVAVSNMMQRSIDREREEGGGNYPDINVNEIVNRFGVRLLKKVLKEKGIEKPDDGIIAEFRKLGYMPYEMRLQGQAPATEEPVVKREMPLIASSLEEAISSPLVNKVREFPDKYAFFNDYDVKEIKHIIKILTADDRDGRHDELQHLLLEFLSRYNYYKSIEEKINNGLLVKKIVANPRGYFNAAELNNINYLNEFLIKNGIEEEHGELQGKMQDILIRYKYYNKNNLREKTKPIEDIINNPLIRKVDNNHRNDFDKNQLKNIKQFHGTLTKLDTNNEHIGLLGKMQDLLTRYRLNQHQQ